MFFGICVCFLVIKFIVWIKIFKFIVFFEKIGLIFFSYIGKIIKLSSLLIDFELFYIEIFLYLYFIMVFEIDIIKMYCF